MGSLHEIWNELAKHGERLKNKSLQQLFAEEKNRFDNFSCVFDDMLLDFSRESIDADALYSVLELAKKANLNQSITAMLAGEPINNTQNCAALHMALRDSVADCVSIGGVRVADQVKEERARFLDFAESVRSGVYASVNGKAFTDVVHVGIGGCHLGPMMTTQALASWHDGPNMHFITNIDGAYMLDVLADLRPETTLLIVSSKSFTTFEALKNFATLSAWLYDSLHKKAKHHMVAVTSNTDGAMSHGFSAERIFKLWDWVGGRYSIWSAVGLPLALAIGRSGFKQFLAGAKSMDAHFINSPFEHNLPVIMALIGIWRRNVMHHQSVALMPYDQRLSNLPSYMQQLEMESNGKRVTRQGERLIRASCPIIWGDVGTNAQHSFFQFMHQGSDVVPVDFLLAATPNQRHANIDVTDHHNVLLCNAIAQAETLAFGRDEQGIRQHMQEEGEQCDDLIMHRVLSGNRPSSLLIYKQLNPETLGKIIALFEHKVFTQGVIWNINSYDQWGVEFGKQIAQSLFAKFAPNHHSSKDPDDATTGALKHIFNLRAKRDSTQVADVNLPTGKQKE